jgi:hypothetical protein
VDDGDALTRTLTSILVEGGDEAPLRICRACVTELPVDGAAITLMTAVGHQELVCASDRVVSQIDELQFRLGEGPCVEAFASGCPVLIPDVNDTIDQRWPMFSTYVRRTPARSLYVLPVQLGAIRLGVIDLYRRLPGPLDSGQVSGALRAADAALWALLGTRFEEDSDHHRLPGQLPGYRLHRAEVHQATGMVVAQAGVSAQSALAMLRASAFVHDRPIDEVARDVVARRLRFGKGTS